MGWKRNGIEGKGDLVPCGQTVDGGVLLVVGCGRNVWRDVEDFCAFGVRADAALINDMILHFPVADGVPVRHLVCIDPGDVEHFAALRRHNLSRYLERWTTHSVLPPCDCVWAFDNVEIYQSGALASAIGLVLGYDRIVLAGCPQDNSGHYYEPEWMETEHYATRTFRAQWEGPVWRGRVRSMSGMTREILGGPDRDWLNGGGSAWQTS